MLMLLRTKYPNVLHLCSLHTGPIVLQHRGYELRPPNGGDEALNLVLYTNEELKAILGDARHQIGAGGFSSVFRGRLPNGGVTVAVKCPRENSSNDGVLETLSKEMVHRQ